MSVFHTIDDKAKEMTSENELMFKVKELRVKVQKIRLDPETLRNFRSKSRSKEVIVISDDDDESNNNLDNLASSSSQDSYELIRIKDSLEVDNEVSLSENESQDPKRKSLILKIRKKKSVGVSSILDSTSSLPLVHSKKTESTTTTTTLTTATSSSQGAFRKERKALLQRLRQQEITSMKKELRERLPEDLRSQTRLEAYSLANSLRTFCCQLETEVGAGGQMTLILFYYFLVQVDSLQFEVYRAERHRSILQARLSELQQDLSGWPYQVTETSDRISISKLSHHFIF